MGFTEILTIIFVILKVTGHIDWSWWIVFLPEIIAFVLYILIIIGQIVCFRKIPKVHKKMFDDFNFLERLGE